MSATIARISRRVETSQKLKYSRKPINGILESQEGLKLNVIIGAV